MEERPVRKRSESTVSVPPGIFARSSRSCSMVGWVRDFPAVDLITVVSRVAGAEMAMEEERIRKGNGFILLEKSDYFETGGMRPGGMGASLLMVMDMVHPGTG